MMATLLILILITAMMRLRRSLTMQTRLIKLESVKLCIYGDGRIVSVCVCVLVIYTSFGVKVIVCMRKTYGGATCAEAKTRFTPSQI